MPKIACNWIGLVALSFSASAAQVPVHTDGVEESQINVGQNDNQLQVRWPISNEQGGLLSINLDPARCLIDSMAVIEKSKVIRLAHNLDPTFVLTVGTRRGNDNDSWVVFFDKVPQRPYHSHPARLELKRIRVRRTRHRATIQCDGIELGPFRGVVLIHVYSGSPLIHIEAAVSSEQPRCAILYDAGLVSDAPSWDALHWKDIEGKMQSAIAHPTLAAVDLAVRHRTLIASSGAGSVAVFPPPHQFFYPLDFSNNLKYVWHGRRFRGLVDRVGFGVRQSIHGDRRFVPWFNAPPKTTQRLGFFVLLSSKSPNRTLEHVLRYTRGDQFSKLDGYRTFTSHYHIAHTMDVFQRMQRGLPVDDVPSFVKVFREMGVNIVHLGEFHGDGNPRDPGPKRLPQLELMHRECGRLSDDDFLLLPGEEPNVHFGGHWMSLFPRPVYWIMNRRDGEPFEQQHPDFGKVYRIKDSGEMLRLLKLEGGLAWTAHARIKSSRGFPDRHRHSSFYQSDRWLGAAWKAMPADLSHDRLGNRVLELMSDMANWGQKKYVIGEVDVFKIDSTHELYGHMNINYLRMDRLPKYQDGWTEVVDKLRTGQFFVTTGEILIEHFSVNGKQSGDTLNVSGGSAELRATASWTFPLRAAEIVSGDGNREYRELIDLTNTRQFGEQQFRVPFDTREKRWVRLELWDIAGNGAFTQPVWLADGRPPTSTAPEFEAGPNTQRARGDQSHGETVAGPINQLLFEKRPR